MARLQFALVTRSPFKRLEIIKRHLDDYEFLAPALEIIETPMSPIGTALIWTISSFVTAALIWACIGQIDIVATAPGKLQPVGRVKIVQPLESGRVSKIFAANGGHVIKGDFLVELDHTEAQAELRAAEIGLAAATSEITRRMTALALVRSGQIAGRHAIVWSDAVPQHLRDRQTIVLNADLAQLATNIAAIEAQKVQKETERNELLATIGHQEELLAVLRQRVDMRTELLASRAGTRTSLIDAMESLQAQLVQLTTQQGQLASLEKANAVFAEQQERAQKDFIADNAQKLVEMQRQAEVDQQSVEKLRSKLDQTLLTAPVTGTVEALSVTNLGQVLAPGQEIMRIVPDHEDLEVEAYVANRDIGFVHVGEEAAIKVDAFPFTRYGVLSGKVERIATDAVAEPDAGQMDGDFFRGSNSKGLAGAQHTQNLVFLVTVKLNEASLTVDGHETRLGPGMTIEADFKTGRRRIIDYLLSPFMEVGSSAMRER